MIATSVACGPRGSCALCLRRPRDVWFGPITQPLAHSGAFSCGAEWDLTIAPHGRLGGPGRGDWPLVGQVRRHMFS
jgi:hypothetical protein